MKFAGVCPRFCFLSSQAIVDGVAISFCHREGATRPWRSSYNNVAHMRAHYLLDCFVSLAMTRECGRYSFLVIARERSDRGDPVIIESRIRACIIYWIASLRSQ